MSILPRDALPSVAGIDQQMIEDIVLDDIVNHDYDRTTKLTLLAVMMLVQDEISDVRMHHKINQTFPGRLALIIGRMNITLRKTTSHLKEKTKLNCER
jgi:hypothetical protein